jgi:hypothetical protein
MRLNIFEDQSDDFIILSECALHDFPIFSPVGSVVAEFINDLSCVHS